uniref:Uncharacterized protein n=1 Tax=Tetranychus urticae TaxID=32264 RepID=T1KEI3_TETUR
MTQANIQRYNIRDLVNMELQSSAIYFINLKTFPSKLP